MATRRDPELLRAVGQRLAELRRQRGFTQEALAEQVGIQPHGLSRIEQGHRSPSLSTLAHLAEALDVTVGELLAVEQEVPDPTVSPDEAKVLRLYRKLDDPKAKAVVTLLKAISR